jgi:Protein of unknown function DUF86
MRNPELPWADMRDMRNIVIHAYFDVQLQVVWRTVQEDLPKLKQQVEHLLSERQAERYRDHVPGYDPPQQTEATRDPDAGRERDDKLECDYRSRRGLSQFNNCAPARVGAR